MKKSVLLLQLLLLTLLSFAQTADEGIRFKEGEPWENVLKMAREQNKYIFMDCYTSWCGPCKALAKDIFTQKKVGDFFNAHFINVKYDMEKGIGKELREQFQKYIIGYPTLLLIGQDGKVVHQMAGFQEADALIAGMKAGMEGKTLFVYRDRYAAGERGLDFIKEYAGILNGAFLKDQVQEIITGYMNSVPVEKLKDPEVWELVNEYVKDPYSPQFEFVVFNLDYFPLKLKADRYKLERQLNWALEKALNSIVEIRKDTNGVILPLVPEPRKIAVLLRLTDRMNLKRAEEYRAKIQIYNLELAGKWDEVFQYLEICRNIGALGYSERYLDEVIQYMAVNSKDRKLLRKGLMWMEEIQAKENKGNSRFKGNYNGTLALLHKQLGNTKEAEKYRKMDEEIRQQNAKEFEEFMKKEK